MHDTVIKGGTVYDGSGSEPVVTDIAVKDGLIAEIGDGLTGKDTIDADGAIVSPAWVDIHTHYDGQVTWDDQMNPSASHGVGTIVMGNCGVGFAPVAPGGEQDLIDLMEGVEDIPGTALHEGMPWGAWHSYPEYLDFLAGREYAINISSLVAHGAVRNFVMGERGRTNQAATEGDLQQMGQIVEEALLAGAVGFSTSRILGHRSIQGEPVPGTFANDTEVMVIAQALKRAGRGLFQIIPSSTLGPGRPEFEEHASLEQEINLIANVSRESGRPSTFTLFQIDDWSDKWQEAIAQVKEANANGAQVFPQVGSRPTGLVFSMETYHPWMLKPTYQRIKDLPIEARLAELRKPEVKQAILVEKNEIDGVPMGSMEFGIAHIEPKFEYLFPLTSDSTYEPEAGESIAAMSVEQNISPESALFDYLTAEPSTDKPARMAILFFTNYTDFDLDAVRTMQMDPVTVTGLSDAGAHVSLIFDAVNPTYQLTYWARDRKRGETLPLSHVIHRATRRNAELFGFNDRGLLAPGMKADLNVIDYNNLGLGELEILRDLPAGGTRIMQGAKGYLATMIDGVLTRQNDQDTGNRPGRLIRSGS
ncbi:MAG: amidohydrolase family protein [Pseudomonadales bacterium]|nr:amidohydrolase family protein [Pseudomonadales bacterium]MBO6565394.1 amidohydrolase family protein [Pseudomonadales bacterium]MBO6597873.1 amidohydrolase family protein [Pseudomonadales bacterium]MBO6702305.1 amidohydrolase family protein [Pseudomonadales bacterium]MBO6824281.1 amidohydrolase family protein [Pseudomonadales bacterium]